MSSDAADTAPKGKYRPKFMDDLSPEEIDAHLQTMPLTASTMPEEGAEGDNDTFKALRALIEETSPEERAESFKESGNMAYKLGRKRWRDAIIYYSQALDAMAANDELNSTLHSNRAQVLLKLGNFGRAVDDCFKAIEFNKNNVKAHYRGAFCFLKLRKYDEALTFIAEGLECDGASEKQLESLRKLRQEIVDAQTQQATADAEREAARLKDIEEFAPVAEAIRARGITMLEALEDSPQRYHGKRVQLDENGLLQWPVMFVYPQYSQSDFIQEFSEAHRFIDHLAHMFPLDQPPVEWDEQKEYTADALGVFLVLADRVVRISPKRTLGEVMQRDDYRVPLVPTFAIMPRGSEFTSSWLKQQKAQLQRQSS